MARKKTPAHRYLHYRLSHNSGGSQDSHYFDLAKDLSILNRRLYKQGKVYSVKSITAFNTSGTTSLKVCTAPDTWMTRSAWKRGKRIHEAQFTRAIEASGGVMRMPTFHDFKVYLNSSMKGDADFYNNKVRDHNGNPASDGEWVYADFETDMTGAKSFKVGLLGDPTDTTGNGNIDYVGLIQSYGEARRTVSLNPGIDSDAENEELNAVLSFANSEDVQDEVFENVLNDNDTAPYAGTGETALTGNRYPGASLNMPSSQLVRLMAVGGTSNPDVEICRGFDAICGLIEIQTTSSISDDNIDIIIELSEGEYKGVKALEI